MIAFLAALVFGLVVWLFSEMCRWHDRYQRTEDENVVLSAELDQSLRIERALLDRLTVTLAEHAGCPAPVVVPAQRDGGAS